MRFLAPRRRNRFLTLLAAPIGADGGYRIHSLRRTLGVSPSRGESGHPAAAIERHHMLDAAPVAIRLAKANVAARVELRP